MARSAELAAMLTTAWRSMVLLTILTVGGGCSTFDSAPKGQREPDGEQNWKTFGVQARGKKGILRENDPLKKWIESDTSQEIQRNLGID